jgi:hypothetical protein
VLQRCDAAFYLKTYFKVLKTLILQGLKLLNLNSTKMRILNINNWNRKKHFDFFSKMASSYFGLTTEVDSTKAFQVVKERNISFLPTIYKNQ